MAPGETNNKPNPAPPEQPSNPIDRALQEFKENALTHSQMVDQLEGLKQQLKQENDSPLNVQKIPELRKAVSLEVSSDLDVFFGDEEKRNAMLGDLDVRMDEIEQIVQQKATPEAAPPEPSLFSKEGMKKMFDGGMKNIGETLTALAVVLDQLREQIAVSIGGNLDMMKSFIGQEKVDMLKGFIGEDRIQLSKALHAAKISLPIAAFMHARKSIDAVRGETAASVRGWTAERMSFVLVQKLTLAGVTGKEVEGDLEQKITNAVKILRDEVLATPLNGNSVDFADAGAQLEKRFDQSVAGKQIVIMSDGSMTAGGQKWKLEKSGQSFPVKTVEHINGTLKITNGTTYESIVISDNLDAIITDLASANPSSQKIAPVKDGITIIEFIRTS